MNKESMNRRKFLSGVAVAGASSLFLPRISGIALAAEATLEETLKWICLKVNVAIDIEGKSRFQYNMTYSLEKLTATIEEKVSVLVNDTWQHQYTRISQIPLYLCSAKDTSQFPGTPRLVMVDIKEGKEYIHEIWIPEGGTRSESYKSYEHIQTSSPSMAERLVVAFKHAITLAEKEFASRPKEPNNEPF